MSKSIWNQRYIHLAKTISTWSKDPSTQIGAVAVDSNRRILSVGYNGFPRNIEDDPKRLADREVKYQYVVHAEMNCIYNATYNGVSLDGSTLYVWGLPVCSECAKGIIQTGIRTVYWTMEKDIPQNWVDSYKKTQQILKEAGVQIKRIKYEPN